ncbi:MAG: NAD-glutamate dehydrogenase [Rickettsiaceae bacterium]|nr:NAD-glutamate dehydrogenase [Rickettsiaceae bacterium]
MNNVTTHLESLIKSWKNSFQLCLNDKKNHDLSKTIYDKYLKNMPIDFIYSYDPREACLDIPEFEELSENKRIIYRLTQQKDNISLKLFSLGKKISLSTIVPIIENLGFTVEEEQSYEFLEGQGYYLQKYILSNSITIKDFDNTKELVEDALYAIFSKKTITDDLTKLITYSGLSWREIDLVRALSHYIHQIGLPYDYKYVNATLVTYNEFAENLINLFVYKFDPQNNNLDKYNNLLKNQKDFLITVHNNSEDKILSLFCSVIDAIVRTNFFQKNNNNPKKYISFKINSAKVPSIPSPVPYAEIFVYSNDFEAIHLRGGKVARGGIRWSDRTEDYRTEVLGLMKAQMTKNSVIVPVGSKGGFIVRNLRDFATKAESLNFAISCYKNFLRGVLDITDNIISGQISHPKDTLIYDEDDPYLVVAADKGTASFSDYANEVSAEYNFWLKDAFASGGSAGYDHKKIGITAKGAWISVKRHFKEIGINPEIDEITVSGIGDMSGDVFGNGMLLSSSIKLVGAFNHMHIFIDPNPNPEVSFKERKRLFNLPGSKWSDYDQSVLSKGGAIYERTAKTVKLSKEAKDLLELERDEFSPDELIRSILKAKVDLVWNGGIGTYVKSSSEENIRIGDKTNDILRINGSDLNAKVVAEGGNLGFSQKGRIEYAQKGGRINTDFIDNSAGVDCSDHEVNIKIVLNEAVAKGKLNLSDRNILLAEMTEQIASLVLENNMRQTLALTMMQNSSIFNMEIFVRLINYLEESKILSRELEFLPSNSELMIRSNHGEKLTRPELSVLLSYTKRAVYNELENSKIVHEEYFSSWILEYFPEVMRDKFKDEILNHRLRPQIILTILTNKLVNQLSGPVISLIKFETGSKICDIARGFIIVQEIFDLISLWREVDEIPANIPINIIIEIYTDLNKVMRRGISWMIRNLDHPMKIEESIQKYKDSVLAISNMLTINLSGKAKDKFENKYQRYIDCGLSASLAAKSATLDSLISSFDIAFISHNTGVDIEVICAAYFKVANIYNIDFLRRSCDKLVSESFWQRLSLESIKDDLYDKQRRLMSLIIKDNMIKNVEEWHKKNRSISNIFSEFVENLKIQENIDISMIILANKKLETFIRKK